MTTTSRTRVNARVGSVQSGVNHDREVLMTWINLELDSGSQGFGGMCIDQDAPEIHADFDRQICNLFGVSTLEECVGRNCWALRSSDSFDGIEGLEVDGKRVTITGFRRQHYPDSEYSVSPLQQRRIRHSFEICFLARRISDEVESLAHFEDSFVDWESKP